MITVALSHLLRRGVRLDTAEAVAIARALAQGRGEPALEGIQLSSDGGVRSAGGQGVPSVAALARLLDGLLPAHGVPAPLRYAVARGQGAVVAPPFASVEEFSVALARFESHGGPEIVKRLVTRGARPPTVRVVSEPAADVVLLRAAVPEPRRRSKIRAWHVAAALALSAAGGFAGSRAASVPRVDVPPAPQLRPMEPPADLAVGTRGTSADRDVPKESGIRRQAQRRNSPAMAR